MAATDPEGGADAIGVLAGWCFDHRWMVIALSVAIVTGGSWLAGTTRIDAP